MSVITIVSGAYCHQETVITEVKNKTDYKLIDTEMIVTAACKKSQIDTAKMMKAFSAKTSVFNRFTHEKERSVAYLKLALAEMLSEDNLLISGPALFLIPEKITHVLRVCLIADLKFRLQQAMTTGELKEKQAQNRIRQEDENLAAWVRMLLKKDDPWASILYDIVIPMDKTSVEEAAALIAEKAQSDVVSRTAQAQSVLDDFLLAAQVEVALAEEGHNVGVNVVQGAVELTINKHVLMLNHLEDELKSLAKKVPGVQSVATRVGEGFHQADIYRRYNFEVPAKVLLVDDEREFVQTLSERLIMRDMGSAVAYDGESALTMVKEDEPEVMILDLKMPGIDGIEVLRRVKAEHPEIEVIVLTGHGSEADKQICMKLGAFAYLQKPVDINVLSETLTKANKKIHHQ
jgi:CheY-like chemotaxis protein/cytidylate kinase